MAAELAALHAQVAELRGVIAADAEARLRRWHPLVERPEFAHGAANLACYLALRHHDIRPLQRALMPLGLSSLGRLEGRVLANLQAVEAALAAMRGHAGPPFPGSDGFFAGERVLAAESERLLGPCRPGRRTRILATCGVEAAESPELVDRLVAAGVDALRLNCAHDGAEAWAAIVAHARAAGLRHGRRPVILMDLAGPRCRTGQVRFPPDRPRLVVGDSLWLVPPGGLGETGFAAECSLPEALRGAAPGHWVMIDEGKCAGVVEAVEPSGLRLRIDRAPARGRKLKPEKGLNFPDSELRLAPLTAKDLADLDVVARLADVIGYSFVQEAADVDRLQAELRARRPDDWQRIGLVAKIETPKAVRNLPEIMVAAAGRQPFGVMIARGDLAVELGFERLAEMQEEIAWLCEAAHLPVVWATQVLDGLVRKGLPSRGEMTDAAMAARAECVMLNKGPYLVEAAALLDRLLSRMAEHLDKKTPTLRALHSW
jgi:pyruvate kinase